MAPAPISTVTIMYVAATASRRTPRVLPIGEPPGGGHQRQRDQAGDDCEQHLAHVDLDRMDQRRDADVPQVVEDVAAQQGADADLEVSAPARDDGGGGLGCGRAKSDERGAHDKGVEPRSTMPLAATTMRRPASTSSARPATELVSAAQRVLAPSSSIGAASPAVDVTVAAIDVPSPDDARVIAVIRDDTPELVEDDPQRPCQPGDRLVLVGRPGAMHELVQHLIG